MTTTSTIDASTGAPPNDWVATVRALGPSFAARAAAHDTDDSFVAQNYHDLRVSKVFSAGVPAELGGGGAGVADLCAMLRELARHCSSTALALSMHTHQVAVPAWRWRNEQVAAVEPLLRRVAAEELVLVTSGGSDWLAGSGTLEPIEGGGYRLNARKVFASGSPGGDLLMTMGILDDPAGSTVVHFPIPLTAPGVKVLDNWRTLGMRGTGSNDVLLEDVQIPEAAIGLRRPVGKWHPIFHLTAMVALPLIYAVYTGIAEAARDLAVAQAAKRRESLDVQSLVGELDNELTAARVALESAIAIAEREKPGPEVTNEIAIRRTLIGKSVLRAVDKAMDVAGGSAFFRSAGIERLFRDAQAARYHPLQEKVQLRYSGRFALGLDVDG